MRITAHVVFLTVLISSIFSQDSVPLPPDALGLNKLSTWSVLNPDRSDHLAESRTSAVLRCNIHDPSRYTLIRLDHDADAALDNERAGKEIEKLDETVLRFLKKHGWSAMNSNADAGQSKRCFQKNEVIAQIYKTTGRCTLHSTCKVYDGLTVTFYLPKNLAKQ